MWLAYQTWYQEYDLGPKMMLNLQKYDLSDAKNTEIVLKKNRSKTSVHLIKNSQFENPKSLLKTAVHLVISHGCF